MSFTIRNVAIALGALVLVGTAHLPAPSDLVGAWAPDAYILSDGTKHTVDGRIFFTESEWLVLFFVLDGDEPRRGSGEGGSYELEGDRLTFSHLYHLSAGAEMPGLPDSPLRMEARQTGGPTEQTRIELEDERMTLHFPSGNAMTFRRTSASR